MSNVIPMKKSVHVALSGSGFKFPAHVGALLAIQDAGYDIKEIAGTSGGSIVATLLASGMSLTTMKELTLTRDWSDMLTHTWFSFLFKHGYCNGKALLNWIDQQTEGKTFADMSINLIVMASDITNEVAYEFSKAKTPDVKVSFAARSSASIPFVYTPMIAKEGVTLMDGGMANNIPVDKLTNDGTTLRLGIQLVAKDSSMEADASLLTELDHVVNLMLTSNEATHVELGEAEDARVVFVETGYASSLNPSMSREVRHRLMDDGYNATAAFLKTLP